MTDKQLTDMLNDALVTERASGVAISNIISTFTWSGMEEETRLQVQNMLTRLAAGPTKRAARLAKLIARVQGGN